MTLWFHALSITLIVLLPVGAALWWRRHSPLVYFVYGTLTFLGAQLVHLPLNWLLTEVGLIPETDLVGGRLIQAALILGLTAGLTEELARVVGFSLVKEARHHSDGVMMGIGHGGLEAILFGGVFGAASLSALYWAQQGGDLPEGLNAAQLEGLRTQLALAASTPGMALLPLFERVVALIAQVSLAVMVLKAFQTGNSLFVLLAIGYHALVDALAVVAVQTLDSIWMTEAILAASVAPLAIWAWRQRAIGDAPPRTGSGRWLAWRTILSKELQYQWRSRRLLIVAAVFVVFGMSAPLVAYFTPEIISSVESIAAFADLIPEPTAADAAAQYVSSITQFGFIIVILLGMGAVAGEKEKGTAAMIISKPLPRWMFIVSKFVAQAGVYLAAFLVAGVGSYYYTAVLFKAPDPGAYLLANGLLFLWLLVFAAVTLLGSTLARTIGAGAGIALAGSVGLLLLGTVPRYGTLAPGGLVSWAGALAGGNDPAPNGGALVAGVVLIILFLLAAVAVFDEQEL